MGQKITDEIDEIRDEIEAVNGFQPHIQIAFRNVMQSDYIAGKIKERVDKMLRVYPRIVAIKVVVERFSARKRNGNVFQVHVDVNVPGKEIVVSSHIPKNQDHENLGIAVQDAFGAALRQLEAYTRVAKKTQQRRRFGGRSRAEETPSSA